MIRKYIFSFLYEYSPLLFIYMSMYFFSALIPDGVGNVCIAFVCLGLLTAVAWVLFPIVLVRIPHLEELGPGAYWYQCEHILMLLMFLIVRGKYNH